MALAAAVRGGMPATRSLGLTLRLFSSHTTPRPFCALPFSPSSAPSPCSSFLRFSLPRVGLRFKADSVKPPKPTTPSSSSTSSKPAEAKPKRPRNRAVTPTYAEFGQLTVAEKVVETSKDVGSIGIIALGIGVAAMVIYSVAKELFREDSATTLYGRALDDLKTNQEVQRFFGTSIVGHGEGRRRKQHIEHVEYSVGDMQYLRMQFHVEGNLASGLAQLEFKRRGNEPYRYRYFLVQDQRTGRRVILQDNRAEDAADKAGTATPPAPATAV